MMALWVLLFWLALVLVLYTYAIYPILLGVISGFYQLWSDVRYIGSSCSRRHSAVNSELPVVAIVIAAHNEEACIDKRIRNLLACDYPREKLRIYIGSDGSSDGTNELVQPYADQGKLQFFPFARNRGKVAVLNELMALVQEPITIFSDANTEFSPDVPARLASHFNDPAVGGVCGELRLVDAEGNANKDGVYWRYERTLKYLEGRIDALLGANGAIYAIRSDLWKPLDEDVMVDDFFIAMRIAQQGYTLRYDPEAVAHEETPPDLGDEFKRRARIGAGNYQACFRMKELLVPTFSWRWFAYISHKVIRWFVPHLMLLALLSNVLLCFGADSALYRVLLLLQVLLYAYCVLAKPLVDKQRIGGLLSLPVFLVWMNVAFAVGFYRFISGVGGGGWQRTKR